MITTQCPGCLQPLAVAEEYGGRQGRCPLCDHLVPFPAAPLQAAPLQHDLLTRCLLLGAVVAFLLLSVAPFLPWQSGVGIQRGDGRLLVCMALLLLALLLLTYGTGWRLHLVVLITGGFATFTFFFLISQLWRSAQAGIYLGLLAALMGSGCGIALAIHRSPPPPAWADQLDPLLQRHSWLLAVQGVAVGLAALTWLLRGAG